MAINGYDRVDRAEIRSAIKGLQKQLQAMDYIDKIQNLTLNTNLVEDLKYEVSKQVLTSSDFLKHCLG